MNYLRLVTASAGDAGLLMEHLLLLHMLLSDHRAPMN